MIQETKGKEFLKSKSVEEIALNNNLGRHIPVLPLLRYLIWDIIQTQDMFHICFYPKYNESDICIYEFRNYAEIKIEVERRLNELNLREEIKYLILEDLDENKQHIENNIKYFGVPNFWSIYE